LQQADPEGRHGLGAGSSLNQVSSYIREEMPDGLIAFLSHALGYDQAMALLWIALETKQADRLSRS
jgi:hypothetical protein